MNRKSLLIDIAVLMNAVGGWRFPVLPDKDFLPGTASLQGFLPTVIKNPGISRSVNT